MLCRTALWDCFGSLFLIRSGRLSSPPELLLWRPLFWVTNFESVSSNSRGSQSKKREPAQSNSIVQVDTTPTQSFAQTPNGRYVFVYHASHVGKCCFAGIGTLLHNCYIRELKQRRRRRQRGRQKSNRLRLAKQQLCTCITLFRTFLCRCCTTSS